MPTDPIKIITLSLSRASCAPIITPQQKNTAICVWSSRGVFVCWFCFVVCFARHTHTHKKPCTCSKHKSLRSVPPEPVKWVMGTTQNTRIFGPLCFRVLCCFVPKLCKSALSRLRSVQRACTRSRQRNEDDDHDDDLCLEASHQRANTEHSATKNDRTHLIEEFF